MVKLIERQKAEGLTSTAFALKLGITGAMWSLVKRGKRSPGRKVLDQALRVYPELHYIYAQSLIERNDSERQVKDVAKAVA